MNGDRLKEERLKDLLLMAIAIQLAIVGQAPPDDSWLPLFFIGILITVVVVIKELGRRFAEYSHR